MDIYAIKDRSSDDKYIEYFVTKQQAAEYLQSKGYKSTAKDNWELLNKTLRDYLPEYVSIASLKR